MTQDITAKIQKKLKKQRKEEGSIPLLLEFYLKLLDIQNKAAGRIGSPVMELDSAAIDQRIDNGLPLLKFDEINIDWPLAREVFAGVLAAFGEYPQLFGEMPEKFKKPSAGRLLTKKAARAWFTGKELPPALLDGLGDGLAQSVIQATLQPFLASYARALQSHLKPDFWLQGFCPVCGGSPDLASLEKDVGERWLLCSRCDTKWRFPRLECPFCRTHDQSAIHFFTDDKGLYRLHVCDNCRGYLKTIDLRKTEDEVLLPLERLYTLDIDAQARERGYGPQPAKQRR